MPIYVVVAALAVALSVPLLVLTLLGGRISGDRVSRNLRGNVASSTDLRRLVLSQSSTERLVQPLLRGMASRARRISPAGVIARLERRLLLAGISTPVEVILIAKLALGGLLAIVGAVQLARSPSVKMLLLTAVLAPVGNIAPDVVLARLARRRQTSIRNELPDMLDQVTVCVEAGLGFDAALARTTRSARTPLSQEVSRMQQELQVGIPRRDALANLLARTDVAELRQFAHALVQAETYGVPVSQMLRAQALEHRERRRQAAEERAMKLPVKISFPLVFCILPAMFIVILGPAAINLLNSSF